MSTSARSTQSGPKLSARAVNVIGVDDYLTVHLEDGRVVGVPIAWFPRLAAANPAQRNNWCLIGRGVGTHWPDLDEDVSIQSLLGSDGELLCDRVPAPANPPDEPGAM